MYVGCGTSVQGATRDDRRERPCSICALQTHFLSRTVTHKRKALLSANKTLQTTTQLSDVCVPMSPGCGGREG